MPTQLAMSDLERLRRDVLSRDPEAALPCNLSDEWLALISRDLEMIFEGNGQESTSDYLLAPMALVVHLLAGKGRADGVRLEPETLLQYCDRLRFEVGLERISRCSDISSAPATIHTIFSDRELLFTEKHGEHEE